MKDLRDSVVLITGGAAGLGRSVVRRFVQMGSRVVVLDRSRARLDELLAEFDTDVVAEVHGDVTDYAANQAAVDCALTKFGRLDTFIGNAALWDFAVGLTDLPEDSIGEAFDEVFSVNVKGYLLGARASAQALRRTRGSMIFTLSNAAFYTGGGGPLYVASKHACLGLMKQLAYELAPAVRVNAVAPTGMPTDLAGPRSLGQAKRSLRESLDPDGFSGRVPLGFLPQPDDYAGSFTFLASRSMAATMTGAVINCDMGLGVRGMRSVAGGFQA